MRGTVSAPHHAFTFHADLYSLGIPVMLLLVPWVITRILRTDASVKFPYWPHCWWLWGAAFTWFAAIQLPDIPISSETTSTTVHLLGGALIGPLLFAYFTKAYDIKKHEKRWVRYLLVYSAVGGLFGLSNEILEFFLVKLHIMSIDITDTSWDIVENFVGLTVTFIVAEVVGYWPTQKATPKNTELQYNKA
jgi:Na+/melibiose symporter-like transporter